MVPPFQSGSLFPRAGPAPFGQPARRRLLCAPGRPHHRPRRVNSVSHTACDFCVSPVQMKVTLSPFSRLAKTGTPYARYTEHHGTELSTRREGEDGRREPAHGLGASAAERGLAGLRALPRHQRGQRVGRRVPVFAAGLPDHRCDAVVLRRRVAGLHGHLPRERRGHLLLPRRDAPFHGEGRQRALYGRLVPAHRGHVPARGRRGAGRRRRGAARRGVGRVLHAVAAAVRQPGRAGGHGKPHRRHGLGGGAVLRAVPHSRGGDGLPHPLCIPAPVRAGRGAEEPHHRFRPAHVRGCPARAPAHLPSGARPCRWEPSGSAPASCAPWPSATRRWAPS